MPVSLDFSELLSELLDGIHYPSRSLDTAVGRYGFGCDVTASPAYIPFAYFGEV
jgi:hypothetical protein